MSRSADHLNEKQLRVLRWVEQGCPDGEYVDDNYGHRITAKALAGRGLLRVEGHGTTWRATLTDLGVSRLAELGPSPATSPPLNQDSEVIRLLSRLQESDGRLDVSVRQDELDYPKLVQRFNRSEHRPRGKQLKLSSPDWRNHDWFRLEYVDWFWDNASVPVVKTLSPGSRLGTLAKAFVDTPDDQFVSKDSLPRAARILESIVRHATQAGIRCIDPRAVDERKRRNGGNARGWSGHLELEAGSAVLRVQIREKPGSGSEKFDYYPNGDFNRTAYNRVQRLPAWQRNRNHTFVPTGELELRITRPGFGFDKARFKDKRSAQLEQQLGRLFQELEVARLEAAARLQREREADEQRKLEWEAAMTRARVLHRAGQEEALLTEQASIWRRHQEVRAFVDELRRRDDGSDEALRAWIATGERVAQRLDAFAALAAPSFPAPTAQDLQPHLSGWSAWGPTVRHTR